MLSSDEPVFGGFSNVTKNSDVTFASTQFQHDGRPNSFLVSALRRCPGQLSGLGCPLSLQVPVVLLGKRLC